MFLKGLGNYHHGVAIIRPGEIFIMMNYVSHLGAI